jgi:hypothetical protein
MFGSIFILVLLPWLDRSPVRSARFRPVLRPFFWFLVADCVLLTFAGGRPPRGDMVGYEPIRDRVLFPSFPRGLAARRLARAAKPTANQHQHTRPHDRRSTMNGRGDWLTVAIAAVSMAALIRWNVNNPLLIAVTAVVGLIAFPLLQPTWVMVK